MVLYSMTDNAVFKCIFETFLEKPVKLFSCSDISKSRLFYSCTGNRLWIYIYLFLLLFIKKLISKTPCIHVLIAIPVLQPLHACKMVVNWWQMVDRTQNSEKCNIFKCTSLSSFKICAREPTLKWNIQLHLNLILYLSTVTRAELEGFHEMQSTATGLKIQKEKDMSGLPSSTQPSHAWASHIQEHGHYQEHGRSGTERHPEVVTNKNHANSSHIEVLIYFCN